tara:strand:- start:1451 stop:1609 length:159 start_codon:yes stop_codon:yes gene_type:complete
VTQWNSIPELGLSFVIEIDAWKHQIFKMPTECAVLHAHVHPWSVDARHLFLV